uniref:Enkurin domain-containing protein n=1 Tax=Clastoptera arizonana TaxID=38151 RepID=A0A1B6CGQ0_9HEMI
MSAIKQFLWQDNPKPKRNFIKENAMKLKDAKKSHKTESHMKKTNLQFTSALSTNRMAESNRFNSNNKEDTSRGISSFKRSLHAVSLKKNVEQSNLEEPSSVIYSTIRGPEKKKEPPKAFRNQACQTVQGKDLDFLSHDGVIRYPSSRYTKSENNKSPRPVHVREMALQTEEDVIRDLEKAAGDNLDPYRMGNKGDIDYVKFNMIAAPLKPKQTNTEKEDPIRAPSTYQKGVLPKYLREQKKDKENEKDNKGIELAGGSIIAQMLLPDDVRKKLLTKLKKEHKELVDQLNQLPFTTSSLKTLQRKQQIEKDLDLLEKRISNFSREKVFIKDIEAT